MVRGAGGGPAGGRVTRRIVDWLPVRDTRTQPKIEDGRGRLLGALARPESRCRVLASMAARVR